MMTEEKTKVKIVIYCSPLTRRWVWDLESPEQFAVITSFRDYDTAAKTISDARSFMKRFKDEYEIEEEVL